MTDIRSLTVAYSDGLNRCDGCANAIPKGHPYLFVQREFLALCSSCLTWGAQAVELAWAADGPESQVREVRKPIK